MPFRGRGGCVSSRSSASASCSESPVVGELGQLDQAEVLLDLAAQVGQLVLRALRGQVGLVLARLRQPQLLAQAALLRLRLPAALLELGQAGFGGIDALGQLGDLPGEPLGHGRLRLDRPGRLGLLVGQRRAAGSLRRHFALTGGLRSPASSAHPGLEAPQLAPLTAASAASRASSAM